MHRPYWSKSLAEDKELTVFRFVVQARFSLLWCCCIVIVFTSEINKQK